MMAAKINPLVAQLDIDAAAVRRLFQDEVLKRERLPSQEACARVADIMRDRNRVFRLMSGPLPALQEDDPTVKAFYSAAEAMRVASERLKESYERRNAEFCEEVPDTARITHSKPWNGDLFARLDSSLAEAEAFTSSRVLPKTAMFDWSLEVTILGHLFDEAMISVDPNKTYGNASDGPRLRFIRIGLRMIADVDMTEAAIKTRLGRTDANRKK